MIRPHLQHDSRGTIRIHGKRRSFLECRRVRRRDYYLLERLGSPLRDRYKAFDPLAGPEGDFFQVQDWPGGAATEQHLRILKRLKDDAFPRVVEWDRHGRGYSCALTWVSGISLAEYFKLLRSGRQPPIDPGEAVRLIRGLAHAVCQLHSQLRICHGDIQPANVVITAHPSRLVLIDFGSAWTAEAGLLRVDGDGRHPCYSAPESAPSSTPVGFHADQFSVSVLFYELLTQQLPYAGLGGKAGRPEFIGQAPQSLRPPSEFSKACGNLPRSLRQRLDVLIARGLALQPEKRFPDRGAWLDELFEVFARFRLAPKLPPVENALTRLMEWFVKPHKTKG
jgi:serine/threonine protein kinase